MKETYVPLSEAERLLDEALDKLPYDWTPTGYENISEIEGIIGKEIWINICDTGDFTLKLGGWVELDRRVEEDEDPYIWFSGIVILTLPNGEEVKFGGGINDDYTVIRIDYDVQEREWSKMYKDSL